MDFGAYLLDIEGTTTPIDFVTRTLFPYARARLESFLLNADFDNDDELIKAMDLLAAEHAADQKADLDPPERFLAYLEWLMDRDRKSTGLKLIQGRIWEEGYRRGEIQGEVYPDVLPAIRRWKERGAAIYIFSSGSVLAQKLLFAHLPGVDATSLLNGYFDTTTGPKRDAESYRKIAREIGLPAGQMLFLSDIAQEVSAADAAGMHATLVDRSKASVPGESIASFDSIS